MTQTATQWLIEEIHKNMGVWIPPHIQDQAIAMEKEQIMTAHYDGFRYHIGTTEISEQYYKDNYNK